MTASPFRKSESFRYLLRFLIAAVLLCGLLSRVYQKEISDLTYSGNVALAFCALDVFRNLFYGLLILVGCLLFLPSNLGARFSGGVRLLFALAFGLIASVPLAWLIGSARAEYELHGAILVLSVLAGLNVFLFILLQSPDRANASRWEQTLRKNVILADLFFPLPVWMVYSREGFRLIRLLRIVLALLFAAGFFCLTLFHLPDRYSDPGFDLDFEKIPTDPMDSFFMAAGKQDRVLWISKRVALDRVLPGEDGGQRSAPIPALPNEGRGMVTFALSPDEREIWAMGIEDGLPGIMTLDAQTMQIIRRQDIPFPAGDRLGRASVYPHPDGQGVLAIVDSEYDGRDGGLLMRISGDPETIKRYVFCGNPYDAAVDPARRLIYVLYYRPGMIAAYDVDSLKLVSRVFVPEEGNQMALDLKNDRLYLAFPVEGVIRVLDLSSFRIVRTVKSIIGVRALGLLPGENRLLAAGFAPYLEIFDLADFRRVNRIVAPPWIRNILYVPREQAFYFSGFHGVRRLAVDAQWLRQEMTVARRYDPFFLFLRAGLDLTLDVLGQRPPKGSEGLIVDCRSREGGGDGGMNGE